LMKLLAAWAVKNLPLIIDNIKIFVKKLRVAGAAVNSMIRSAGGVFSSLTKIITATLKNISEFDFTDQSNRIEEAKLELDKNVDAVGAGFDELKNVWSMEEDELDKKIAELESQKSLRETIDTVSPPIVQAQTPAVGDGSGSGKADNYGMKVDAVTNSKWKPVLNLIAKAESIDGSYSSAYHPNGSKIIPGLENMSMEEAVKASGGMDSTGKHYAIGRYQFTRLTTEQAGRAGLKPTDKFSPENQDKMAIALITGKKGVSFDMLKKDPKKAQLLLSQEWAGIPKDISDKSFYGDDGVNSANVDTKAVTKAFSAVLSPTNKPAETKATAPATTQRPQSSTSGVGKATDARGMSIGSDVLYAKQFDTKDYNSPSPIIRTSDRGMRGGRMHQGIDFGTGGQAGWYCGLLLDGVVSYVGYDGRGGNMVFIRAGGLEYVFMHLAKYSPGIRQGAKYAAGQPIGEVGNTGQSAGIHLHFEVRKNNKPGEANSYVKYVVFGKLKKTSKSSASISSTSRSKSEELASSAASMRTNNTNEQTMSVMVIRQLERVIT